MSSNVSRTWTIPLQVVISVGTPHLTVAEGRPTVREHDATSEGLFGDRREDVFPGAARRFSLDALPRDSFSWQNALNAALCSHLAYRSDEPVRHTTQSQWGFDTCEPIAAGSTECFVASTPKAVVVAFRGTQQTADWLINLDARWTTATYGAVHRGFYDAFQSVRARLEAALVEQLASRKKVIITGHSLGGALSTIAAAEWYGRFPITGVYTFGQPAVGFTALRSYLAVRYPESFHRFVNEDDIVPRVPPAYRHVGKLYHFTGNRVTHEAIAPNASHNDTPTMNSAEFAQLKAELQATRAVIPFAVNESLRSDVPLEGWFPSVSDHAMDRYIEKVSAKLA